MNNRILQTASILGKLIIGLGVALFVLFFVALIYWHVQPSAFSMVDLQATLKAGFGVNGIRIYSNADSIPGNAVLMSEINQWLLYWIFIRGLIFIVLTVLITLSALRIIRSIRSLRTFYRDNVRQFKRIAFYGFIAFFFSLFNISYLDGQFDLHLKTAFGPLVLAIGALVLAEVFKEGAQLLDDQKLII